MKIERSLHKQDPPETQFHQSKECKAENRIQINNEGHILDIIRMVKAPQVDIDIFDGNPLDYTYFRSNFREIVEATVEDQHGRLLRLIKYTSGEAKDLIKHCVHEESNCFDKAMALLDAEYGNSNRITELYLKQLNEWPSIKLNDAAAFKKLYRFLLKCQTHKRNGKLLELDSTSMIRTVILKLHSSYYERWSSLAEKLERKKQQQPNFNDLIDFIDFHSSRINNPSFSVEAMNEAKKASVKSNNIKYRENREKEVNEEEKYKNTDTEIKEKEDDICKLCKDKNHDLETCTTYISKNLAEKWKIVRNMKLCFSCLLPIDKYHRSRTCKNKKSCSTCNKIHPTSLHDPMYSQTRIKFNSIHHKSSEDVISLCVVPVFVSHKSNPDNEVLCYALLDKCCTGCLALPSFLEALAPDDIRRAHVSIETVNALTEEEDAIALDGLVVRGFHDNNAQECVYLPATYSSETIPASEEEIPTPANICHWDHLHSLSNTIPKFINDIPIALIIGASCPKANEPLEVIPCQDEGPFAFRTRLGWCVVGSIAKPCGEEDTSIKCNRTRMHFNHITTVKDKYITKTLEDMYSNEFNEDNGEEKGTSCEDDMFMKIMNDQVKKEDGHYVLPLPFRQPQPCLPNNRQQALIRLHSVKRKMFKDVNFRNEYTEFVEKMLRKGYAKKTTQDDDTCHGKTWYLPHHGIFHPTKGNIRVVFDCSARYGNRSLNEEVLQGPDLTNGLLGVLLRFRERNIGIMADIEAMFFQVRVPKEHQSYLRFLWWPNGDVHQNPEDYEMCVHTFGALSSNACANFALKKTASDGKEEFGEDAAHTLNKSFYVDDLLKSLDDEDKAISLLSRTQKMCKSGGFNLTKIISSSKIVIESIPAEHRAPSVIELDFLKTLPIERALGVIWSVENDTLGFKVSMHDTPLTRRGVLSTISSIHDPLGIVSPFLLKGRKTLQEITCDGQNWDDPISQKHVAEWTKWRNSLPLLNKINVNRCYKSKQFGEICDASLHGFPDACLYMGYGVVFYLRLVDETGRIEVSLVMAKSRVTPIKKPTTIPRLELTAAELSSRVGKTIKRELEIKGIKDLYWVDSMITLGYIHNDNKRFKIFVANRAKRIKSVTTKEQWRYISSKDNPGDDTSRGISLTDVEKVNKWFKGPEFLYMPENTWKIEQIIPVAESDVELKRDIQVHTMNVNTNVTITCQSHEFNLLSILENKFSCWKKITRVLAIMMKFCYKCNKKPLLSSSFTLSTSDIEMSEEKLIWMSQTRDLKKEVDYYLEKRNDPTGAKQIQMMRKASTIWRLDPFVDEKGILCVGGRMGKADLIKKHPVILSKHGLIVKRLIQHLHQQTGHGGRTTTMNALRQNGYWIISASTLVKSTIHLCISCRKYRGKLGKQKMANLPEYRINDANLPPFSHCGVDMFGPFRIKQKRSQCKRFVALFTCLTSRAIHLEVTNEMSTDSFILCLRRFLARRGPTQLIKSDNGTNFLGAENEFRKAFQEMNHEKINNVLLSKACDWIVWSKNPPDASHMGGIWERQIRTVRNVLTALLDQHSSSLNDESFSTLLAEAETIVNSRPLTTDSLDDPLAHPLTPNCLLTLKHKPVFSPPGIFQNDKNYCRRRWRFVQHLADIFWKRWRQEYLTSIQARNKWEEPHRNFEVGDIVMLKDDSPRQLWPLAKILQTFPDPSDGLVRKCELLVPSAKGPLLRPIHKLVLLVAKEEK